MDIGDHLGTRPPEVRDEVAEGLPEHREQTDLVLDDLAGLVVDRVDEAVQERGDVLAPAHFLDVALHGHEGNTAVAPELLLEFQDAASGTLALIKDVGEVVLESLVVEVALRRGPA